MVGPNDRYQYDDVVLPEAEEQILRGIDPSLPTLFLDVDGVVNALARTRPHPWGVTDVVMASPSFTERAWPIYTSDKIGPALLGLGVNIVWLTTWKYDANTAISPLVGLPTDLPVGDKPRRFSDFQGWKTEVVIEHLGIYNHPVIWVDDEAIPMNFEQWAAEDFPHTEVLTVRTNPFTGLLPDEVEQIQEWLDLWVRS